MSEFKKHDVLVITPSCKLLTFAVSLSKHRAFLSTHSVCYCHSVKSMTHFFRELNCVATPIKPFLKSSSVKVFSSHPRHHFLRDHTNKRNGPSYYSYMVFINLNLNTIHSVHFKSHLLVEPSGCELCKYYTGVSAHMLEWCQTGRSISGPCPLLEPVKRQRHNI